MNTADAHWRRATVTYRSVENLAEVLADLANLAEQCVGEPIYTPEVVALASDRMCDVLEFMVPLHEHAEVSAAAMTAGTDAAAGGVMTIGRLCPTLTGVERLLYAECRRAVVLLGQMIEPFSAPSVDRSTLLFDVARSIIRFDEWDKQPKG